MRQTRADASRRTPTLEDVARAAGVSRATVSRVVNGSTTVDPRMRSQVAKAIETTGYIPNAAARTLVNGRTGAVALVISGSDGSADQLFRDPFFGRITGGVVRHLRSRSMHPTLMLADSAQDRQEAVDFVRRGNADGALLVSTHAGDPLPRLFVAAGIPAVLFARPAVPVPISFVDLAHAAGAALAADRLADRGCRRVVTIAGPADLPAANDRLAGFQRAMERRGVPYVEVARGNFTTESGEQAMTELLAAVPDVDGVFVANDLMAIGALRVLHEHGRSVPDDVALIGFDDSEPARMSRPRLTTISQPVEKMAERMAAILLDRLDARRTSRCTAPPRTTYPIRRRGRAVAGRRAGSSTTPAAGRTRRRSNGTWSVTREVNPAAGVIVHDVSGVRRGDSLADRVNQAVAVSTAWVRESDADRRAVPVGRVPRSGRDGGGLPGHGRNARA